MAFLGSVQSLHLRDAIAGAAVTHHSPAAGRTIRPAVLQVQAAQALQGKVGAAIPSCSRFHGMALPQPCRHDARWSLKRSQQLRTAHGLARGRRPRRSSARGRPADFPLCGAGRQHVHVYRWQDRKSSACCRTKRLQKLQAATQDGVHAFDSLPC